MGRPKKPLEPRYGRLSVITDLGGTDVFVRCDCGKEKWVARSNLRAGRVVSCGGAGCRSRAPKEPLSDKEIKAKERAPKWLPLASIPGVWNASRQPNGLAAIAHNLNIAERKVVDLVEAIRAIGGIAPYMAWATGEDVAPPKSTAKQPVTTAAVPPPPAMYTGPL